MYLKIKLFYKSSLNFNNCKMAYISINPPNPSTVAEMSEDLCADCNKALLFTSGKFSAPHDQKLRDDVLNWKHFPLNWPFVRGIRRRPVNSPHKGQWRGALLFSLICVWITGWVDNRDAGNLRRHRSHYEVTVMISQRIDDCVQLKHILFISEPPQETAQWKC